MGVFSRRNKDQAADQASDEPEGVGRSAAGEAAVENVPDLPDDYDGRPISSPLTDADRSRIARGLDALAARGIDVDDLAAIGAAYDTAFEQSHAGHGEGPDAIVELFGVAIGEHLVRHSAREWAVVTDVFGTDLGLVGARADTAIVPHNLVSARWMRGETGWIPGVVSHLVRLRPGAR